MTGIPQSKSYVHGTSKIPLLGITIGECLQLAANDSPDALALCVPWQNIHWSYSKLFEEVCSASAALAGLGLQPGQRLGILAPNCAEWIVLQFASARIGVILVNLNPAYGKQELEYALVKSGCQALALVSSFKSSNYLDILSKLACEARSESGSTIFPTIPQLKDIILLDQSSEGYWNYAELVRSADSEQHATAESYARNLQFDDIINIQFTSGTTGSPKATALTHHNILNNAWFVGQKMNLDRTDKICVPVPLYHCFGMVLGSLCALTHRASTVLTSPGFDPKKVLQTIANERCTTLYGVPTMFIAELEQSDFKDYDLTSLRTGIMAGAPCPKQLMEKVISDMHLNELTIAYGMTETGPVSFQTSTEDDIEMRTSTVGRVLPHVEVKIVDEKQKVVPLGEEGELLTRGYNVMPFYWGDEEKTADAIDVAGWIASGDRASIDEHGYCRIVGRIKDMLIRGGENIFPAEIEQYLYRHPDIEQVEIIGVSDEKYGEEVCAWIKLREGASVSAEQIVQFCQGNIAHFKIPQYIKFVTEFPMTVTGKVQKFKMREQMDDEIVNSPSRYRVELSNTNLDNGKSISDARTQNKKYITNPDKTYKERT